MLLKKRFFLLLSMLILLGFITNIYASSKDEIYTNWRGLAIKGYDPVSYFKQSEPVKGSSKYQLIWKDAKWRFSSEENKILFKNNPDKYAPQYGGYCSYAVANGYTASIDPDAWTIVNGKLYLNYSLSVKKEWEKDIPNNIKKADKNWPGVLK